MGVHLATVYDALKKYNYTSTIPDDSEIQFDDICLLTDRSQLLSQSCLYVCDYDLAMKLNINQPGYYYVCASSTSDKIHHSLHCIQTSYTSSVSLYSRLYPHFNEILRWERSLKDAIIRNCTYHEFIDIAHEVLAGHLLLLDYGMNVISAGSKMDQSEQYLPTFLKNNKMPIDVSVEFISNFSPERFSSAEHTTTESPMSFPHHALVARWITSLAETPPLCFLLIGDQPHFSRQTVDKFGLCAELLLQLFRNKQTDPRPVFHNYDPLFINILKQAYTTSDDIRVQADKAAIPFEGIFDIYLFLPQNSGDLSLPVVYESLFAAIPEAYYVSSFRQIMMINCYQSRNQIQSRRARIMDIISNMNIYCGIGPVFTRLDELLSAYNQTVCSIDYLARLGTTASLCLELGHMYNGKSLVIHYKDIAMYKLVDVNASSLFDVYALSEYLTAVKRLQDHDTKNGSNYSRMLFVYLTNERKTTDVAQLMFLSRTTLLYHISKIESILNLSLDDWRVRMNLLLAYHRIDLEMVNRNSAEMPNLRYSSEII